MHKNIHLFLLSASCVLLSLGFIYISLFFHNKQKNQPSAPLENLSPESSIILQETDLHLFGRKNIKNCHITALNSKLFPNKNQSECLQIHCQLTTDNNSIATLRAEKALIDHSAKTIFLPHTVTGSFLEWTFTQQDVFYDATTHIIKANQTELAQSSKISIQSKNSTFDLKNETILLENGVLCCFEQ